MANYKLFIWIDIPDMSSLTPNPIISHMWSRLFNVMTFSLSTNLTSDVVKAPADRSRNKQLCWYLHNEWNNMYKLIGACLYYLGVPTWKLVTLASSFY